MRRLVLVSLLFLPLAELFVIVQVASWIGALPTILLLVGLSVVGVVLVQRTGLGLWQRTRRQLAAGERPGATGVDGLLALLGAVLLAVPGFLTAIAGLVLLVPPVRSALRGPLSDRLARRIGRSRPGTFVYARTSRTYVGDVTPPSRWPGDGQDPPAVGRG
jgi:UPF0716 protein FxsA